MRLKERNGNYNGHEHHSIDHEEGVRHDRRSRFDDDQEDDERVVNQEGFDQEDFRSVAEPFTIRDPLRDRGKGSS